MWTPPKLIIGDENYRDFIGDGRTIRYNDGTVASFGWEGRQGPYGSVCRPIEASGIEKIDRVEWPERIKEMRAKGLLLSDLMKRAGYKTKFQNGLGYCWIYGATSCLEALRIIGNHKHVPLSPESCGGQITGWRNRGGYAEEGLEGLQKYGACEQSYVLREHVLSTSAFKPDWKENGLNYKLTNEWFDVRDFDWLMTAVLLALPVAVGHNWWGHLICHVDPWMSDNEREFGTGHWNSHGANYGDQGYAVLKENKARPDGAWCCMTYTPYDVKA